MWYVVISWRRSGQEHSRKGCGEKPVWAERKGWVSGDSTQAMNGLSVQTKMTNMFWVPTIQIKHQAGIWNLGGERLQNSKSQQSRAYKNTAKWAIHKVVKSTGLTKPSAMKEEKNEELWHVRLWTWGWSQTGQDPKILWEKESELYFVSIQAQIHTKQQDWLKFLF